MKCAVSQLAGAQHSSACGSQATHFESYAFTVTAVGVDLGTTNSVVAVVSSRAASVVPGPDGKRLVPSVVSFQSQSVVVGEPALRGSGADTFYNVKRLIGRQFDEPDVQEELSRAPFTAIAAESGGVLLRCPALGRSLAPEEVSAHVLRHLASLALAAQPQEAQTPVSAVVAVPARFTNAQRMATRAAATQAGLDVLRIINEPTAAALAYGFGCPAGGGDGSVDFNDIEEQLVLVFDLGGGTLDVSIVDVGCGIFHVLGSCGDARLGGSDFDAVVTTWMQQQQRAAGMSEHSGAPSLELLAAAEAAKIALSEHQSTEVVLDVSRKAVLTRDELQTMATRLLERCATPLYQVMSDARRSDGSPVRADELAAVLLVGGATRMPAIRDLVKQITGHEPLTGVDPDEVVALGCAIQAAALVGNIDRGDAILLDETPEADDFRALMSKMQSRLKQPQ